MTFAQYMGLFNKTMQMYAEINKDDGGPYMLRWLDREAPHAQRSEYQEALEPAAVRAHALAPSAKNGEVLAYVGAGCVWRTYWPSAGAGPLIGAGPQLSGVIEIRDSRDSGTGVRYAGVFTLQFRKSPTQGLTTMQYVGLVQVLFAAHALVRKFNTKVAIFSADGTRRFTVSGVHDPVLRTVYPNRTKRKPFDPATDSAEAAKPPVYVPDAPLEAALEALNSGDDEPVATPPITNPTQSAAVPAPVLDDLPVPPFRPGQTHAHFSDAGVDFMYGPVPLDSQALAAYKKAWAVSPMPEERQMYKRMFPGGKP
jgi:hypothetical protein